MRYLVPTPAEGSGLFGASLARIGSEQPVAVTVVLFLLFAFLVRYWRFYLPGARYWALGQRTPHGVARDELVRHARADDLTRAIREPRTWARLERSLPPERHLELQLALSRCKRALEAGDIGDAARAEHTVRQLADSCLWARERRRTVVAMMTVMFAGLAAVIIRHQIVTPCRVLSASMLPTLMPGDLIAADRLAYGMWRGSARVTSASVPRRGDVIVFRSPTAEGPSQPLIKRVIGLPGDRIGMHASRAVINGWEVPACDAGVYLYVLPDGAVKARLLVEFLEDQAYLTIAAPPLREFPETYDVQPGEVFVLGDNRNNSSDSRAWNEGHGAGLPISHIDGRARWFLLATRRDQRVDASRLLQSIAGTELHLEGLDTRALREEIAKCLRHWPEQTRPPAPGAVAPAASAPAPAPPSRMIGE